VLPSVTSARATGATASAISAHAITTGPLIIALTLTQPAATG
jgi:hypothetical protein